MSGPIQTIPQGLLGLLQLKELGRNPPVLVDAVSPNLDLFALYAERVLVNESQLFGNIPSVNLATAAHGQQQLLVGGVAGAFAVVPQNEMWYCTQCGIYMQTNTIAAADTVRGGVFVSFGGSGLGNLITPATSDVITARARTWVTEPMPRPMFFGPGSSFWFEVFDILAASGPYQFNLSMRAVRLPI